jgi:hypothetical protein
MVKTSTFDPNQLGDLWLDPTFKKCGSKTGPYRIKLTDYSKWMSETMRQALT